MSEPKSIVTKWLNYCMLCGRPNPDLHHGLWGSKHKLADQDHILLPLCQYHHNSLNLYEVKRKPVTNMSVHHCEEMKILSQQLSQLAYERYYLAQKLAENQILGHQSADDWMDEAREAFRKRYGESYL